MMQKPGSKIIMKEIKSTRYLSCHSSQKIIHLQKCLNHEDELIFVMATFSDVGPPEGEKCFWLFQRKLLR